MNNNIKLKNYIIFIYSKDINLFKFCEYICSNHTYNEDSLDGFINLYKTKNKEYLSLFSFLQIIYITNSWIEMPSICKFILNNYNKIQRKIEYEEYGCVVYENFIKYNYSLHDRINILKEIIKEKI